MFTGIVQDLGKVVQISDENGLKRFWIQTHLPRSSWKLGASVAVNGVCLTVENRCFFTKKFQVCTVQETLEKTLFKDLKVGDRVHLEPSLRMSDFLSGHLVLGHVDGLAEVLAPAPQLKIKVPAQWLPMISLKGSITIHGVSLTVAQLEKDEITVALIPETLERTLFSFLKVGDFVHIEVDSIARTLYRFYEKSA